jgi:hypothetical protein
VRYLHDGSNRAIRRPVPNEQVDIATAGNGERRFGHAPKVRAASATLAPSAT